MVSGNSESPSPATRQATIIDVCRQGLVFGETSAAHLGEETLNDGPTMVCFLLYIFGAITHFGDQIIADEPLDETEKKAAMAEALAAFESSTPQEIRATVVALADAAGVESMRMKAEGRRAAAQWRLGSKDEAAKRFMEIRNDPRRWSGKLEPLLMPLIQKNAT